MLTRIRTAVSSGTPAEAPRPIPRAYHHSGSLLPGSQLVIELLTDRLVDYKAEVHHCSAANLTDRIAEILAGTSSIVVPSQLPPEVTNGCRQSGATVTTDRDPHPLEPGELDNIEVVVTGARIAIAVTGTIILDAANDQGRRAISLVPDRHLIVIRSEQVVETVPEALTYLNPTAPLTMISGPSATSDIELERVEGVHGPRTLQVLIVRNDET